jgi:uncharacterized protein YdeI (YjbR/CyaY-like superfamily)
VQKFSLAVWEETLFGLTRTLSIFEINIRSMGKKIPAVDKYIANSKPFAQPILEYLREIVHSASPKIEEVMKWSFPHFEYKGNICSMASFKEHCAFGFWKGSIMKDEDKIINPVGKTAMGSLGRITSIKDLPSKKILVKYIKEAIDLNEKGVPLPKKAPAKQSDLDIPEDFANAIAKNKKAKKVFDQFSPSHKKEYIMWIVEAKREETRKSRIDTALEWIAEGKGKNWKYERK